MSQTVTAPFAAQDALDSKALDYAFVIAGWPTVYTVVKNNYAFAGDLANFTSMQSWASIPDCAAAQVDGRPEEGGLSIGQLDIGILDRHVNGKRQLSDLLSRQAYLDGNLAGTHTTSLTSALSNSATIINVASCVGFPSTGTIYVGQECIAYTSGNGTVSNGVFTSGTQFGTAGVPATRGYLLTSPTPQPNGGYVYSYMPSIFRRRAFLYKGYQNLTLNNWARAFGGVLTAARKAGPSVGLSVMSTTWEAYLDGGAVLLGGSRNPTDYPIFNGFTLNIDVLSGDFNSVNVLLNQSGVGNLNNGHYLAKIGGHWAAITGVS